MAALRSTDTYTIDVDIGGTFTDGVLSGALGRPMGQGRHHSPRFDGVLPALRRGACRPRWPGYSRTPCPNVRHSAVEHRRDEHAPAEKRAQAGHHGDRGRGGGAHRGARQPSFSPASSIPAWSPASPSPSRRPARSGARLDEADVRQAMERLLDDGARGIVVSFDGATANPAHELLARRVVHAEYPRHYLGAVHTWLGAELSSGDDPLRRNTAVLNGYLHRGVATSLYKSDEALRQRGFKRPLLVEHSRSGTARVAKTTALNTYNSGPVAGLVGCARLAKDLYGIEDLVSRRRGRHQRRHRRRRRRRGALQHRAHGPRHRRRHPDDRRRAGERRRRRHRESRRRFRRRQRGTRERGRPPRPRLLRPRRQRPPPSPTPT